MGGELTAIGALGNDPTGDDVRYDEIFLESEIDDLKKQLRLE